MVACLWCKLRSLATNCGQLRREAKRLDDVTAPSLLFTFKLVVSFLFSDCSLTVKVRKQRSGVILNGRRGPLQSRNASRLQGQHFPHFNSESRITEVKTTSLREFDLRRVLVLEGRSYMSVVQREGYWVTKSLHLSHKRCAILKTRTWEDTRYLVQRTERAWKLSAM